MICSLRRGRLDKQCTMDHGCEYNKNEKAKARKSGPGVLRKTKDLGVKADIFASAIYWDPTHLCHRLLVHLPKGETAPDVNRLVGSS